MIIDKIDSIPLSKKNAENYIKIVINEIYNQAPVSIKYLGGGSFGSAFLVKLQCHEIVIKFLRAKNMLSKEVYDLKLLSDSCTIKFPQVLFSRNADNIIPLDCYGMSVIDGKSAFFNFKKYFTCRQKRKKFADSITTALHEIHSHTNDKFGDTLNPIYDSWLDFYKPFAKAILDKAEELYSSGQLSKKIINAMHAGWEKFDIIFSEQVSTPCLIHGDLNIANIMADKNLNITGFIDPLNSMYADKEYDLFQFDNIGGKRFFLRQTYIEKYGASKNCDAKCAFYGLWNEVYCYIKSGTLVGFIMNPLIKNMYKQIKKL